MAGRVYLYLPIIAILFGLGGCEDIFVENISDDLVQTITPVNNAELKVGTVSFVWEELYGAEDYRVVIVSPSFSNIQNYVCDSILTGQRMDIVLLMPDMYEWSIEARNFGYKSLKTISKFGLVSESIDTP